MCSLIMNYSNSLVSGVESEPSRGVSLCAHGHVFVSPFIKNATKMVMCTRCFGNELGFAGTLHIPRDVCGKKYLQMSSMFCTLLHHWTALHSAYWAVYAPTLIPRLIDGVWFNL